MSWRSAGESQPCPDSIGPQGWSPSGLLSPVSPLASKAGLALPSRPLPLQEGPAEAVPGAAEAADAPGG